MADNEVPEGTFDDYSETNSETSTHPDNYEICQLSGFKVKPEDLVRRWDGLWVKREFVEGRHPQDFTQARPEHPRPSPAPELPNEFRELPFILATESGDLISREGPGYVLTEADNQITAADL